MLTAKKQAARRFSQRNKPLRQDYRGGGRGLSRTCSVNIYTQTIREGSRPLRCKKPTTLVQAKGLEGNPGLIKILVSAAQITENEELEKTRSSEIPNVSGNNNQNKRTLGKNFTSLKD